MKMDGYASPVTETQHQQAKETIESELEFFVKHYKGRFDNPNTDSVDTREFRDALRTGFEKFLLQYLKAGYVPEEYVQQARDSFLKKTGQRPSDSEDSRALKIIISHYNSGRDDRERIIAENLALNHLMNMDAKDSFNASIAHRIYLRDTGRM